MRTSTILAALSLSIATSFADDLPAVGIAPPGSYPDGCEKTATSNFTIGTLLMSSKHKRVSAETVATNTFVCSLEDGVLRDPVLRIGSIVANYQFQFDGPPPQAGAIWTGGWSVCKNNSLAIGPSTTFYHCMSGSFANIYSENIGAQCTPMNIVVSYVDQASSSSSSSVAPSSTKASSDSVSATSTSGSVIPLSTGVTNGTMSSTGVASTSPSTSTAGTATSVPVAPDANGASSTGSTGGAVPTRMPRRETFGAVVGILGAALIL